MISDDRIEKYFSLMRCLAGMRMKLNINRFCQNVRTHFLRSKSESYKKKDESQNKLLCESFYAEARKLNDLNEKNEVGKLFKKSQ